MVAIKDALPGVKNAKEHDVKTIITALEAPAIGFDCTTDAIDGPFKMLDLAALNATLNAKHRAIVKTLQEQGAGPSSAGGVSSAVHKGFPGAASSTDDDLILAAKPASIGRMVDTSSKATVGSCVLIGQAHRWIATAWHVVEPFRCKKKRSHLRSLYALFPNGMSLGHLVVVGFNEDLDVCVLQEAEPQPAAALPPSASPGSCVKRGDRVVLLSYPLVIDANVEGVDQAEPAALVGFEVHAGNAEHAASYLGFPNCSGGAVFGRDGKIAGIHTGTISHSQLPSQGGCDVADVWREMLSKGMSEVSVYTDMNAVMALIPGNAPLTARVKRRLSRAFPG